MSVKHTYLAKDGHKTDEAFTRGKAIRQKCLDCCCWQEVEIRQCPAKDCALFPFRMGRVATNLKIENMRATSVKTNSGK